MNYNYSNQITIDKVGIKKSEARQNSLRQKRFQRISYYKCKKKGPPEFVVLTTTQKGSIQQ